jgi:hypothetical protein
MFWLWWLSLWLPRRKAEVVCLEDYRRGRN